MRSIRRSILTRLFELLYGPLVLLHEPLGNLAYGPAWKGRRSALAAGLEGARAVIDVGAGEGYLVRELLARGIPARGYEPSPAMRRRARRRSTDLGAAPAGNLPVPDSSVDAILVSYPGPWIFEPETWREFARVLAPGGALRVLAGGRPDTTGRGLRKVFLRLVYGGALDAPSLPASELFGLRGEWQWHADAWGAALVWSGVRNEAVD